MKEQELRFDTQAIHTGEHEHHYGGAVVPPIFQSSTYVFGGQSQYDDIRYLRLNNSPNHDVLCKKIAALEKSEAAIVTASGMAAITTSLLALFDTPIQILTQDCLYGGTHHFFNSDLRAMGYEITSVDLDNSTSWKSALTTKAKVFYVETISNPLLDVPDLAAIARFCRENNLISVIDNTLASPVNCNPIDFGFDLVLHSCTKYMNGHSDIVAGCVAGKRNLIEKITRKLNILGACMDPHVAFLLNRGLKTLGVRVRHQNQTALQLAHWFEKQPFTSRVLYPGLKEHKHFQNAQKYLKGPGGILSFEYKGSPDAADQFLSRLRLPQLAPSLGGVESLITRPTTTSHSAIPPQDRARIGIKDNLIRLSVGLENLEDLMSDFEQAARV